MNVNIGSKFVEFNLDVMIMLNVILYKLNTFQWNKDFFIDQGIDYNKLKNYKQRLSQCDPAGRQHESGSESKPFQKEVLVNPAWKKLYENLSALLYNFSKIVMLSFGWTEKNKSPQGFKRCPTIIDYIESCRHRRLETLPN